MEKTKTLMIQIPDEIIKNEWFTMDAYTFAVYVRLKWVQFRLYGEEELTFDHKMMMHKLFISDTRTLKRCFKKLHQEQIILELISKLPTKGDLNLTFNAIPDGKESRRFTQLPITLFHYLDDIGVTGLRLMYYYESYINRTQGNYTSDPFAFPSIETISKDLNINSETVIKYNTILHKKKLIKVVKHKLEIQGYNEKDEVYFDKYNNHYHIRLDRLVNK